MIPSRTWFPASLADRAAWMQNFATQFAAYAATLGLLPADVTAVASDNEDFQSIATTTVSVDQFRAAVIQYRINLTEGDIGDPQPVFPSESFAGPPNDRPAGLFERLDKMRNRILASPTYTPEIGTALNIIGGGGAPTNPGGVTPTISVEAAQSGSMFSCVVSNRADSDSWSVQILRSGSNSWETVGTFTGKSADVDITLPSNQPQQMQVRVQLRKANAPYGNTSQAATVTVNP